LRLPFGLNDNAKKIMRGKKLFSCPRDSITPVLFFHRYIHHPPAASEPNYNGFFPLPNLLVIVSSGRWRRNDGTLEKCTNLSSSTAIIAFTRLSRQNAASSRVNWPPSRLPGYRKIGA
jgi:hypothetical protein